MLIETNKMYHADSYKFIKNFPDKSIDCIYTDIPYKYDSGGGGSSALSKRIIKVQKVELIDISNGIDNKILDDFVRVMKKINIFIWCSKLQIPELLNYFLSIKDVSFEILMWGKTNPTPAVNNVWLPNIEYCLYFREKGVRLNDGYEHKSKYYISGINKSDKDDFEHPTIKPLSFVKNHLLHATKTGDLVVDFFAGSGTTCVACKACGRNYIGVELDEEYFNLACDRLNGVTREERLAKQNGQMSIFDDEFK